RFSRDWSSDVCSSDLVGAVVGEQVVGLERRRSDDAIGLGDHLVFGGNPEERLGGLVVTPVEVLQPPQRVEGVGQRAIDTTLDQRSEEHTSELQSRENL